MSGIHSFIHSMVRTNYLCMDSTCTAVMTMAVGMGIGMVNSTTKVQSFFKFLTR